MMVTGMGPEKNMFLCFSTAFKRRRWEVEKDTSTALELLYIGNLKEPQKHKLLQKVVAPCHRVLLPKPAA